MKLAVAGTGYVGLVTAVCLAERGHTVSCVDVDQKKIDYMKSGKSPIYEQDLEELMNKNKDKMTYTTDYQSAYRDAEAIFIGVGTPQQEDGTANLSYVRIVAKQIAQSIERDCVIVIKSTVPIGTNDEIEEFIKNNLAHPVNVYIASNPEFLSQGTAVRDTLQAKRIVVGTECEEARKVMENVYKPFNLPMVYTNRRSAEMIKYASNDFLALKISYMNDIANLCELVGADIDDVKLGMSYDPRIGDKFLNAGIGYGGSCFPKDTNALYYLAKNTYNYELKTIKAAIDVNAMQKTKLFYMAKRIIGDFSGVNVAILGLTFKPGTDDVRDSPSFDMIDLLLKDGAKIHAYDPVGMNNMKRHYPDEIMYFDTPEEAVSDCPIVFVLTEWNEISQINLSALQGKKVFDGRNCLKITKGICEYYPIGKKASI
ncbi:MAG: UDP-glucose/GDP-mannose dehydrogenase family protein [Erysipelotrichales bacterium]|nr:UDP-glucose/GDP-mannose dehydrogenase family protein [Erysipelotrichales bacterium]